MGVHRERLVASKTHRRFVEGAKAALQRLGPSVPIPSDISPAMVGAKPLSLAAPPTLEEAFGYRGSIRFVAFGYSPRTRKFGHCDGGDDIPGYSDTWLGFLNHPFIAPRVPENRYPTLYGVFSRKAQPSLHELMEGGDQRIECFEPVHCLLLDREKRELYICRRDQMLLFFLLTQPDEGNRIFIDGLRMSPGNENYEDMPAPEAVEQLRTFLDNRLELSAVARTSEPVYPK